LSVRAPEHLVSLVLERVQPVTGLRALDWVSPIQTA
jgi:hypothetical protein